MPKLTVSAPLMALLPMDHRGSGRHHRSVDVSAASWPQLATELRARFPALAERVLTASDELASGFVLVVNDEVLASRVATGVFRDEDEVCFIAAIAGG